MSREIVTKATQTQCPHGGTGTLNTGNSKVFIQGSEVLVMSDEGSVAGCSFTLPNGKPQPCTSEKLLGLSTKVFVGGRAALLKNPSDMCFSAESITQGPVTWSTIQEKVKAL